MGTRFEVDGTTGLVQFKQGGTDWTGISAPAVSASGHGRIYYDSSSNTFKASLNGAAYGPLGGANAAGVLGSVQLSDGSQDLIADGSNFFWDTVTHRLGIGTNTPSYPLHIHDSSTTTSPLLYVEEASTGHAQIQIHSASGGDLLMGWDGFQFAIGNGSSAQMRIIGSNLRLDGTPLTLSSSANMAMLSSGSITVQTSGTSGMQLTNNGGGTATMSIQAQTSPGISVASTSQIYCDSTRNILMLSNNHTAYAPVQATSLVTIAAAYTILSTDFTILAGASGGAYAVTLPSVSANSGKVYNIKKTDSSSNAVTVTPASGTIDGASTFVLTTQYQSVTIHSDGTNWWIL